MDGDLEKAESKLADAKHAHEEGDSAKSTAENLQRKIQILEEELDTAEKNLKETVDKYVLVIVVFSAPFATFAAVLSPFRVSNFWACAAINPTDRASLLRL